MIETKSAYISKLDKDTIKVVFKPHALLTNVEYNELFNHYQTIIGRSEGVKFLVIMQEGFKTETNAITFFKKNYRIDFKKAEAFIVLSPSAKMFFKVGLNIIPNKYPKRLFDSEKEAIKWLNSIH